MFSFILQSSEFRNYCLYVIFIRRALFIKLSAIIVTHSCSFYDLFKSLKSEGEYQVNQQDLKSFVLSEMMFVRNILMNTRNGSCSLLCILKVKFAQEIY